MLSRCYDIINKGQCIPSPEDHNIALSQRDTHTHTHTNPPSPLFLSHIHIHLHGPFSIYLSLTHTHTHTHNIHYYKKTHLLYDVILTTSSEHKDIDHDGNSTLRSLTYPSLRDLGG